MEKNSPEQSMISSNACPLNAAFPPEEGPFVRAVKVPPIQHPCRKVEAKIMEALQRSCGGNAWLTSGGFVDGILKTNDASWVLIEHKTTLDWNSFRAALAQLALGLALLPSRDWGQQENLIDNYPPRGLIVYERWGGDAAWTPDLVQWMLHDLVPTAVGMQVGILLYDNEAETFSAPVWKSKVTE